MAITTIIFGVEEGISALPVELAPFFVNTTGDFWAASFPPEFLLANGITPTPAGDAMSAQYITDIRFQGRDYQYFVGSGTVPCYEAFALFLDADFVDNGPTATASPSINNALRNATDGQGNRKIRFLQRASDSVDVSVVPSNVIAGQDYIEAGLEGTGLAPEDVQVEAV
jgi:hypothetical protein